MIPPLPIFHLPGEGGNGGKFDNATDGCPIPGCRVPGKLDNIADEVRAEMRAQAADLQSISVRLEKNVTIQGEQLQHLAKATEGTIVAAERATKAAERAEAINIRTEEMNHRLELLLDVLRENNRPSKKG